MNAISYALVLGKVKSVYEGKVVTGRLILDMVLCWYTQIRMGWDLMITCMSVSEKVKHFFRNMKVHCGV